MLHAMLLRHKGPNGTYCGICVDLAVLPTIATHKVKPPAIETNAVLQEAQPLNDVVPDALLHHAQQQQMLSTPPVHADTPYC